MTTRRLYIGRSSRFDVAIAIAACTTHHDHGATAASGIMVVEVGADGSFSLARSDPGDAVVGDGMDWLLDATRTIISCALLKYRHEYIKHEWEWGHFFSTVFGCDPRVAGWGAALDAWEPTGHERMRIAAAAGLIEGPNDP